MYNEAKALLWRHLARLQDSRAYPAELTQAGAVLHRAPSLPPRVSGPSLLQCTSNSCRKATKNEPRQANHACAYLLCKQCCVAASETALNACTFRVYCRAHAAPGFEGEPAPNFSSIGPVVSPAPGQSAAARATQSALPVPAPPSTGYAAPSLQQLLDEYDAQFGYLMPDPLLDPPNAAPISTATTSQPQGASTPSQQARLPTQRSPRKGLAMPIHPLWQQAIRDTSAQPPGARVTTKTAHDLAREARTKIMLVLWFLVRVAYLSVTFSYSLFFKPGELPFRLEITIPTFPHVKLLDIPVLVESLSLTNKTLIDCLDTTKLPERYWVTRSAETLITVDTARHLNDTAPHLFLRLRKDITYRWSDADCPELDAEVELTLSGKSRKRRPDRAISALPQKVARSTAANDITSVRLEERTSMTVRAASSELVQGPNPFVPGVFSCLCNWYLRCTARAHTH